MLAGKGARRVFIRVSYRKMLRATVQFVELDRDAASRLREALDDALPQI